MWVGIRWLVLNCHCNTCTKNWVGVQEVIAMHLVGTVEDYKLPDSVTCPECSGTEVEYIIEAVKNNK